jgi:hypothetical protein
MHVQPGDRKGKAQLGQRRRTGFSTAKVSPLAIEIAVDHLLQLLKATAFHSLLMPLAAQAQSAPSASGRTARPVFVNGVQAGAGARHGAAKTRTRLAGIGIN